MGIHFLLMLHVHQVYNGPLIMTQEPRLIERPPPRTFPLAFPEK